MGKTLQIEMTRKEAERTLAIAEFQVDMNLGEKEDWRVIQNLRTVLGLPPRPNASLQSGEKS